jgi:dCMP deaminase
MRKSKLQYFIDLAKLVSSRASCSRRQVGCVLVDEHDHVLSTGYNGPPKGIPNCTDKPCAGAHLPSGQGLDVCQAVHAEMNAVIQCKDVHAITKAYVTTAPCLHCLKVLANTSCQEILFVDDYPGSERSKDMWEMIGRKWTRVVQ